eukprot:15019143-Heterocapsa_arctica.AAC.1
MVDSPRRKHWCGKLPPEESWPKSEESISAAYIDCSKCYGRVDHNSAATAAVKTGRNNTIVALSFDTYKTPRIAQVHKSNTQPIEANR